jgi:hypothetical protein
MFNILLNKVKILRENVQDVKLVIKPNSRDSKDSGISGSSLSLLSREAIECQLVKLEKNAYQVFFELKSIERHYVEIYFNNEFVNFGKFIL